MQKYILLIITILSLSSCKKWLDVKPESQVSEEELFKTEAGFQESLNGVYNRCIQQDLYGGELTFGFPEVLAQNYTIGNATGNLSYLQTYLFNYKDQIFISRKDNAWKGLYNAITNCNLILENLDKHKEVLSAYNYTLIKGEALALRGYLHFDVLRLFAPSYVSNASAKAIPYIIKFSNKVTPLSTVTEALTKMTEDLNSAKELLRTTDSILSPGYTIGYPGEKTQTEDASRILFLQNRRHRMNYYAVCGTLARVYQYMDKKAEALSNALEVINAKKFPWTQTADFINPDPEIVDRIMYPELVFGWASENAASLVKGLFTAGTTAFYIEQNACNTLYETGGVGAEDNRFKQWFKLVSQQNNFHYLLNKYLREEEINRHPLVAPAIRLSELYYIAAECTWDADQAKALGYLNMVRGKRGINSTLVTSSKEQFIKELLKEARKEWYAEGQIFYMYKRLNQSIVGQAGNFIPASDKVFVLPLPDDEIEFGQR